MMKTTDRDARLKLLTLQGTLCRGDMINAKITLCQPLESFGRARRLLRLLAVALQYRKILVDTVVPQLLVWGRGGPFVHRALLVAGLSLLVCGLVRRRTAF